MKGLIASFVLCTIAFMQVESYIVTVDSLVASDSSPIIFEETDYIDYDEEFKFEGVFKYTITFKDTDGADDDIPIEYLYIDEDYNIVDDGETSLCNATLADPRGTVAAIVAMALGIESDPVCPRQESSLSQQSVFAFNGGDFTNLPDSEDEDDILSVKLEIYVSNYMSMKLSITDEEFWFDDNDEIVDPDENPSADTDETNDDSGNSEE